MFIPFIVVLKLILTIAFWWLTEEVTPDLIPHSEVKLFRGNDTHTVGKVARRQNRVVNIQIVDVKIDYNFNASKTR